MAATARRSAVLATPLKLPPVGSLPAVLVLGAYLVPMGLTTSWSATRTVSDMHALSAKQYCCFNDAHHAQAEVIVQPSMI
jgi:hypothetical protein